MQSYGILLISTDYLAGNDVKSLIEDYRSRNTEENRTALASDIAKIIENDISKLKEFRGFILSNDQPLKDHDLLYKVFQALEVVPETSPKSFLPDYVYRGDRLSPLQMIQNGGITLSQGTRSILKHKMATATSIYVSTSKSLNVAIEHACQFPVKFVYRIAPIGGICTNSFLSPIEFQNIEEEVVFPFQLPIDQIKEVAVAKGRDTLATEFYPMENHMDLMAELIDLGIVMR